MEFPAEAFWIGSEHPFDLHEAYVDFEKRLSLATAPRAAHVMIAADSRYRLWINGDFVGRGPARSWPQKQQFDVIDVSAHLRAGENIIHAQVYSPGYSHFAYVHRGVHGLLLALEGDGATLCVTDGSWLAARNMSWRDDVKRVSIYGGGVERRDMRLDSAPHWRPAKIMARAHGPLWQELAPRDVPLLVERVTRCDAPVFVKRGSAPADDDPHLALRAFWHSATQAPYDTARAALRSGEAIAMAFDLGESQVCLARVQIEDAKGGERLLVSYAEKLRDGDLLISDPSTYCRMRLTDEFVLRPGAQTAEPFSLRGARYVVVMLSAPADANVTFHVEAVSPRYPLAFTPVKAADPQLQSIADLCTRTTLACLQDGFVDSVWRESSQWLGDGVAQAFALAALSDDLRPLKRMIVMAADGAYSDGLLPSVLPGEVHAYTITDYNFSWIELLHFYCTHPAATDNAAVLSTLRPALDGILNHFQGILCADGLLRPEPGRRLFLDWSPVDRRDPSLTYNGRYLYALQLAAALTGRKDVAAQARTLQAAMRSTFCADGVWAENTFGTPASQLGLALALLTGCMTQDEEERASRAIVARSLDLEDAHTEGKLILASPFMHHYVFLALEKAGQPQQILDIIRDRWGRWAAAGEATCWENWNVDFPDGSKCHGFSAHPLGWIKRLR